MTLFRMSIDNRVDWAKLPRRKRLNFLGFCIDESKRKAISYQARKVARLVYSGARQRRISRANAKLQTLMFTRDARVKRLEAQRSS